MMRHPFNLAIAQSYDLLICLTVSNANSLLTTRPNRTQYSLFACLQVVDSPDSKGNCGNHTAKAKEQDGGITAIQSGADTVPHFFGIATTGTRALWAAKTDSLFLKEHARAFSLCIVITQKKGKNVQGECTLLNFIRDHNFCSRLCAYA